MAQVSYQNSNRSSKQFSVHKLTQGWVTTFGPCIFVKSFRVLFVHELNIESEVPAWNRKTECFNLRRFNKPEYPVLSNLAVVRGTIGVDEKAPPLTKRCLDGRGKNHDEPKRLWRWLVDLIEEKERK
jgi:hypothetical protein